MRPCLKSQPCTPTGSELHLPLSPRKCVAFQAEESLETVFLADDWDRTPTEPSRKLSYQELLELKEIQRSLPRADQPADLLIGRAGRQYLKGVPITLVPLLPASDASLPRPPPSSSASPQPTAPWTPFTANRPSPHTSQPAGRQGGFRPKPQFAFLPLLDSAAAPAPPPASTMYPSRSRTPSPSRSDPPTPALTNASLESSPMSQASSCSPEPPMFQMPPGRGDKHDFSTFHDDVDAFPHSLSSAMQSLKLPTQTSCHGANFGRSNPAFKPAFTVSSPTPAPKAPRKRNVMFINGMEIDLDDDEDDEPSKPSTPIASPRACSPGSSPSSITSNGLPTPPPSTSPSPTLSHKMPLPPTEPESPFAGLHAPIRFKRSAPPPKPSSPISCSPPPSSPTRRGSICKQRPQQSITVQF